MLVDQSPLGRTARGNAATYTKAWDRLRARFAEEPEAKRRAEEFCRYRMPKFLGWFETVLDRNPKGRGHLVGARVTYADLSLFQLVAGLAYAFPNAARKALRKTPKVAALAEGVAARPRIAAYLASERRIPFNEYGIFRHYPELDL